MRALLLIAVFPALALAQASAPAAKTLKDKEEIKFNEIERGFTVEVAGGVGMDFNLPGSTFNATKELIDRLDVLIQGGVGLEYYTRLRHFTVGLEANFQLQLFTTTFGMTITPTLRYSF